MVDRVAEVWGTRTPYGRGGRWPVRVDRVLAEGVAEADVDRWVQSACVLCSNGCGCDIAVQDGRMVGVRGRAAARHGETAPDGEPERLHAGGLSGTRSGPVGLLRDLQDLYLLAGFVEITWTMVQQAGRALRDRELLDVVARCDQETSTQVRWLRTRTKQAAPQALVAAS